MPNIIATVLDNVDPLVVPTHRNSPLPIVGVVGHTPAGSGGPVIAGKAKRVVATIADPIKPHGNPTNPKLQPGYNKACGCAVITTGSATVLVNNKPVAWIGSLCSCTHKLVGPGEPTILVGK